MSERRNGIIIRTPRNPPASAIMRIGQYLKKPSPPAPADRNRKPVTVKTMPAATDSPAEPMVWTMLFSRMVEPIFLKTAIDRTAMGMEALTVTPARSAR